MSQLTSHILDTARGKPAWGVNVTLYQQLQEEWVLIAQGVSNKDGRVVNLLPEAAEMEFGTYKLSFDTLHYFNTFETKTLYPFVEICFYVHTLEHYHIPLLISPYGYSTYRGS